MTERHQVHVVRLDVESEETIDAQATWADQVSEHRSQFTRPPVADFETRPSRESAPRLMVDAADAERVRHLDHRPALFAEHPSHFAKRLEAGEACLVAEAGGAIVGYIWIQTHGHFDGWLNLAIDQSDTAAACVIYNAYTVPEYRKRGVRTLLLMEERRWCRENGRTRIIFWLDSRVAERALLRWQDYSLEAEMLGELVTQVCLGVVPFSYWRFPLPPKTCSLQAEGPISPRGLLGSRTRSSWACPRLVTWTTCWILRMSGCSDPWVVGTLTC